MSKYRKYQWPQLFAEYEQSGQTQAEFCKQHGISPKYFSLKLAKRNALPKPSNSVFTQASVESLPIQTGSLMLEVGNCKIHCPSSMPTVGIISLIKELA